MWYSPAIVVKVAARIGADLAGLDPNDTAYFEQQEHAFTATALSRYDQLRSDIRARFAGTPVGATESIVVDLAADLGLRLVTPPSYMQAISEGDDPTPQDRATVDAQVAAREIRVLVFNSQNSTPDVQALLGRARAQRIPVVSITETLDPAGATFQDWQARQLQTLEDALQQAAA
jgi:zinc/manganese transport system substrate-binding protein